MARESVEISKMGVMLMFFSAVLVITMIVFYITRSFGYDAAEGFAEINEGHESIGLESISGAVNEYVPCAAVYSLLSRESASVEQINVTFEGITKKFRVNSRNRWAEFRIVTTTQTQNGKTVEVHQYYEQAIRASDGKLVDVDLINWHIEGAYWCSSNGTIVAESTTLYAAEETMLRRGGVLQGKTFLTVTPNYENGYFQVTCVDRTV